MTPSTTADEIANYRRKIEYLFVQGGCLTVVGYTRYAIDALRRVRTYVVRGRTVSFGCPDGPPAAMLRDCLERMHGWCAVAYSTLEAEFPSFELIQSFSVFSLVRSSSANDMAEAGALLRGERLSRLAETFGVDAGQLKAEVFDHRPLALAFMRSNDCTAMEAWRTTTQRTRGTSKALKRHPSAALHPVLIRWLTFMCTTSQAERGFAKMLHTLRPPPSNASQDTEADAAKCVLDYVASEEQAVIEAARKIWVERYGRPRIPSGIRLDQGVRRVVKVLSAANRRSSEIAFLRKRRHAMQRAAAASQAGGQIQHPDRWLPEQAKEVKLHEDKREKRLVQALREGTLRAEEISAELKEAITEQLLKELLSEKRCEAASRRAAALETSAHCVLAADLAGKTVWVDNTLDTSADMRASFARHAMRLVETRCEDSRSYPLNMHVLSPACALP